jgi:hypothetical protein
MSDRTNRLGFAVAALAGLSVPTILVASSVSTPNSFAPNTAISSAQMNENFAAFQAAVNSKQDLVAGTCSARSAIRAIDPAGAVTCQATGASFGDALTGGAASPGFSVANSDPNGSGLVGRHSSAIGIAPAVEGNTDSAGPEAVGVLGRVTSTSPGGFSAAVRGINAGTGGNGIGVYGSQDGAGWGVYGTAPSGIGVRGFSTSGNGLVGSSGTGRGVYGAVSDVNGTGVAASGGGPAGTALSIANGGIKVVGAGVGSATPVFIHLTSAANTAGQVTTIDNPLTNGDPDAIVLVTHRWTGTHLNHATGVYYTGTQWAIFNEDLAAMPLGVPFNVLVVKP